MIVGRKNEIASLEDRNGRNQAQLIAVYGRRRVGKTFLIQEFFKDRTDFTMEVVGQHGASMEAHLSEFRLCLERVFGKVHEITSWRDAFQALVGSLSRLPTGKSRPKSVLVFLDEFPWMDTPRSGLVDALAHVWETDLKKFPFLRLVICGSAASWMIRKIIDAKGSLHNRVTEKIKISPFLLSEMKEYFDARKIAFSETEILEIHMALGGLPFYLDHLRNGESPTQALGRICFGDGPLVGERKILFQALFDNPESHDAIVNALANKRGGLTRSELTNLPGIETGGRLTKHIEELVQSGFIAPLEHWDGKNKNTRFTLIDPFLLFYHKCMVPLQGGMLAKEQSLEAWLNFRKTQSFASLQGYAFENTCLLHAGAIRRKIGLAGISVRLASWVKRGNLKKKVRGGQVDLVFDRDDGRITLCEMKHYPDGFSMSNDYSKKMIERTKIFVEDTKTKKTVENILICSHGATPNAALTKTVSVVVASSDLF